MEPFDRRSGSERPVIRPGGISYQRSRRGGSRHRTPKAHAICDGLTAGLICFMVMFTPWAFGTTQFWSIWTMNITGFVLGILLLIKGLIRWRTGYRPSRWGIQVETDDSNLFTIRSSRRDLLTPVLAGLTVLVLLYTLVSAVNARATFLEWERRFEYHDCLRWLPHSYDSGATWSALWRYAGLACLFWAARDWLLGKTRAERRSAKESEAEGGASPLVATLRPARRGSEPPPAAAGTWEMPARMRLLLWVLCINASLLALEAILQRLSGTNKLLWLVVPRWNDVAAGQFGPYAYRANAASYFNLVWPVCLGFWLVLRRAARSSLRLGHRLGSGNHLVLLPGAVLMAACPIISTSRGGALVAVATIVICMGLLLRIARQESLWFRVGTCSLFAVILGFSAFLGLKELVPRFQTIFTDQMSLRTEIYANAVPIAREFPVFGTGAGTFGSVYQLYRITPTQDWAAYVHDDWLETRISFGWVGFSMILLMLGLVLARWFAGGGIPCRWEFPAMIWVALGGGFLHAKFDFPLQIYSILFLFLLLCVMLFCLSRPEKA